MYPDGSSMARRADIRAKFVRSFYSCFEKMKTKHGTAKNKPPLLGEGLSVSYLISWLGIANPHHRRYTLSCRAFPLVSLVHQPPVSSVRLLHWHLRVVSADRLSLLGIALGLGSLCSLVPPEGLGGALMYPDGSSMARRADIRADISKSFCWSFEKMKTLRKTTHARNPPPCGREALCCVARLSAVLA